MNWNSWRITQVHRDIKPANILLDQVGTAKLCDLGVSFDALNEVYWILYIRILRVDVFQVSVDLVIIVRNIWMTNVSNFVSSFQNCKPHSQSKQYLPCPRERARVPWTQFFF